jgi:hypothetical protein
MKTFQSIILVASIVLVSASVSAGLLKASSNEVVQSNASTLVVSSSPTKQAAYKQGQSRLSQLNSLSSQKLSNILQVSSLNLKGDTIDLKDGGYVTIEERMDIDGNLTFVNQVHVGFHYLSTVNPNKHSN